MSNKMGQIIKRFKRGRVPGRHGASWTGRAGSPMHKWAGERNVMWKKGKAKTGAIIEDVPSERSEPGLI